MKDLKQSEKRVEKQIKKNNIMSNSIIIAICTICAFRFLVLAFTNQAEGLTGTILTCCYVIAFVAFATIGIFKGIKIRNLMG